MKEQLQEEQKKRAKCLFHPYTQNSGQLWHCDTSVPWYKICPTKAKKEKRCICLLSFREAWDYYIMLLAIIIAATLPLELSFEPENMKSYKWVIFNRVIVDGSFFIDIIIIFRTAIINNQMLLITDAKQIAISYLKGMFWIDFLSTVPLDSVLVLLISKQAAQNFRLLVLLKLFRIVRLRKVIGGLNIEINKKILLKIIKLIVNLLLYIHI